MQLNSVLVHGGSRVEYNTKETAQFIRQALKAAFPGVKFSVRTDHFSMGSSTDVRWTDGPTTPEVERVTNRFTSQGFDGMTDCTTYHEQEVNGQRVKFSGWVTVQREVSAALLEKAIARYNVQRAEYGHGPVRLHVVTSAHGHSYLDGEDKSALNPCGGSATWTTDAVNAFAYRMRANGCVVTIKPSYAVA